MDKNSTFKNPGNKINKAVCIDTKRIYDSCVSKDCLECLRVTFFSKSQRLIDEAVLVKCRDCEVETVLIDLEEVQFNRGFYSVDLTYYFKFKFDTFKTITSAPQTAIGYAIFSKKCILYGSDGNVKIFSSSCLDERYDEQHSPSHSNPSAKVQVVDPVVLSCEVIHACECQIPCCCCLPSCITAGVDDMLATRDCEKAVLVSLGLFTIIQIERDVQMLIPAYDYCIPQNECCCDSENPCNTFSKIDFPVNEFFPPEKECPAKKSCCEFDVQTDACETDD